MTHEARLMSGIILITFSTIRYGRPANALLRQEADDEEDEEEEEEREDEQDDEDDDGYSESACDIPTATRKAPRGIQTWT